MALTKEQALTVQEFHENGCSCAVGPRGGRKERIFSWRRNGATKTWKTRPDEFYIPVKYGMRDYGSITHSNASSFHAAEDCPLRQQGDAETSP